MGDPLEAGAVLCGLALAQGTLQVEEVHEGHGPHDQEGDERVALSRAPGNLGGACARGLGVRETLGVHLHDPEVAGHVEAGGERVVVR